MQTPCPAEIENARAYLAECVLMQDELLQAGDRVGNIQLGFVRCAAQDRLRELERAEYRALLAKGTA